ncbi:inorganic anion exchanger [Aureococcus anophagefferens]|nr:inorganic anion exchanger [Aureococcus anophagefferens]
MPPPAASWFRGIGADLKRRAPASTRRRNVPSIEHIAPPTIDRPIATLTKYRRAPHYVSDWTEGHNAKTTASIFFMFFTSIAPAITFAELLDRSTGKIGVVEVCLSSCLSGCIFSIFGGQPSSSSASRAP